MRNISGLIQAIEREAMRKVNAFHYNWYKNEVISFEINLLSLRDNKLPRAHVLYTRVAFIRKLAKRNRASSVS